VPVTTTNATPAALLEHEHQVLRRFPDYARLLDPDRARTTIARRLASASRVEDPVPHLVVHDLLEPELYALFEAAWPANDIFKRDAKGRKFDLVPASPSDSGDARNAGYYLLPSALRAIWDFFVFVVNRQIVGPWLARSFEPEIRERLALLQRAHADGLITYAMAGAQDWSFRPNVGRFMVRANGYVLKPHLDSMPYLVTALLYFPAPGQDTGWGTSLYTPEQPLDFEACVRSGSTEYFDDAGIECREVVRVPYLANTLLAFPNTLRSAHGVVAPEHEQRRVFQYHLSLKGDHEKV
jgi:hypothetical protein